MNSFSESLTAFSFLGAICFNHRQLFVFLHRLEVRLIRTHDCGYLFEGWLRAQMRARSPREVIVGNTEE